ncbi:hypothetical protein U9M48_014328 [Paspalum notatum var. saurae]|uniref:CCHC-type domain-containing protein n=1 Tax=Paspalum notatum var. saurae TaxID=547442 RepID=A0AAQ3WKK5_PASNO
MSDPPPPPQTPLPPPPAIRPSLFHQLFPNLPFPSALAARGSPRSAAVSPAAATCPSHDLPATDPRLGSRVDPRRAASYADAAREKLPALFAGAARGKLPAFTRPQPPLPVSRPSFEAADPRPRHSSRRAAPNAPSTPSAAYPGEDSGWHAVKAKYWWRRRPNSTRRDGAKPSNSSLSHRPSSAALQLFNSCTQGRCFKCLAPDHRAATCRNTVRCFGCRRFGHRLRGCKHPRSEPVQPVVPADGQRAPQPAQVTMVVLGDPCTRPDEDDCVIPTSFDIESEAKEWESTALIPWAFSLPQGAGVRQIKDTILDEFRLLRDEVIISKHSPEAYLIKFVKKKHCEAAYRRRCIKRNGIVLCLRPYRSLEHAIGARFFFRVRICLEGVPRHAWIPDVVEGLLGRSCSMQYIETDLLRPTDTRAICLWAWSRNPSRIPKKIWLTFTNRAMGEASSSWQVAEEFPEKWQFGAKFQVLVHLDLMEDFSSAPSPLPGVAMPPFTPARHPFTWFWGKADGEPGPDRVYEHPSPPRTEDGDRGRGREHGPGRRRVPRPADTDDHPGFQPPCRRDEPDDDNDGFDRRDHHHVEARPHGRGWQRGLGGSRARSRSPRRREQGRPTRDGQRRHQLLAPPGFEFKLPSLEELRNRNAEGL